MHIYFPGLKIGHITSLSHATGLTVFLPDYPVRCGRWLCGSAPATRDCDLLAPENLVDTVNALLFTGGSAFGLDAAHGVMQWLKEKERGWPTDFSPIPIVPTASIYNFSKKNIYYPTAKDAYQACLLADSAIIQQGQVGAGTGAKVGKLFSHAAPMSGGFGFAQLITAQGLNVTAFVVVNCAGDVFENTQIIAGACDKFGNKIDSYTQLLQGHTIAPVIHSSSTTLNTTLAAIFTNAYFTKPVLTRIARAGASGIAQAIRPVFTSFDGDIIFAISTDKFIADEITVATLATETIRRAIIQAVKSSVISS